jgi:tetratricopeptide (TPR) repeat protein
MNQPRHFPGQLGEADRGGSSPIQHLLLRAVRHHRAGQLTTAARIYRQILGIDPEQADSLHLLGMIAHAAGGYEIAAAMIRKAIGIAKNSIAKNHIAKNNSQACYHANLGTVLQAQGQLGEAAESYKRAIALDPGLAEVLVNLGNVLQEQQKNEQQENKYDPEKLKEALSCYARAAAIKPELAEAHYGMGNALQSIGGGIDGGIDGNEEEEKLNQAVECYQRALAIRPAYPQAHYNLGCVLRSLGHVREALAHYHTALELKPDYVAAGFRESLAQLVSGDFTAGWRNYERRWHSKDHGTPMRGYAEPLWSGEKLASCERLLIWGEQGVGDEVMFAGIIPDVIRTGTRCVLDCDARLKPLFARSFPEIEVVSGPSDGNAAEGMSHGSEMNIAAHLPCGSLPGLFRPTEAVFAATTSPYLFADAAERDRFRARYSGAGKQTLIGVAWHTSNRKTGRLRSIDLSLFAPLFARPDIRWISLQYGNHDELESQAAAAGAPVLIDRTVDQLANIDTFAAQIAALDMVVTIDNSTAHLAGALGIPTLVLLPFAPDWRWLLARDDSPWYPTVRLFRQPKRGDWRAVVQEVNSRLVNDLVSVLSQFSVFEKAKGATVAAPVASLSVSLRTASTVFQKIRSLNTKCRFRLERRVRGLSSASRCAFPCRTSDMRSIWWYP